MEEDINPNDETSISLHVLKLRRRLELLKREYEKTARRLQRAEHRDAIRRQSRISHQNTLTHNESSSCLSSSSETTPEFYDNQTAQELEADIVHRSSFVFSSPAMQFPLADLASSSSARMRSPAHRLRSKRSRLRLQNKERESDTENSQEKKTTKKESKNRSVEENGDVIPVKVERNQNMPKKEKTNNQIDEAPPEIKLVKETNVYCENKPIVLNKENNLAFQTPKVENLHDSSYILSSESVTVKPEGDLAQTNSSKADNDITDNKDSLVSSGVLDTCTLIEGLPFPVEYYIRTTRRMSASQSSVNLDAVIHSQLTRGRGRRRLSQSQARHVTPERSESASRSNDQTGRRGTGQGRTRGRRRGTKVRTTCSKGARDSVITNAGNDALVLTEPKTESTCQPEMEERPQEECRPIPSPESNVNLTTTTEEVATRDFKHLPDSQLYFEPKLVADSDLYPIFKRGRSQTGRPLFESQKSMGNDDQSPLLPSLASLIQALQDKDTKNELLAAVDVQDFHLPDEDFGQLKLEKLQLSTSLVEPFVQRMYHTRRSNRRKTSNSEEPFTLEPPTSFASEDSLPLCQSDPTDQSQTHSQSQHVDTVGVQEQTQTIAKMDKAEQEPIVYADNQSSNMVDINPKHSVCPALLNLSPSLTSHTPRGHDSPLPSLGMTPCFSCPGSPKDLQTHLLPSADSCRSPSLVGASPDSALSKTFGNVYANTSMKSSDPMVANKQTEVGQAHLATSTQCDNAKGHENFIEPFIETETQGLCLLKKSGKKHESTSENESQRYMVSNSATQLDIQKTQNNPETKGELRDESQSLVDSNQPLCGDDFSRASQTLKEASTNQKTLLGENPVSSANCPDAGNCSSMLKEMYTFKALEAGWVLDLCLVRWSEEDWCICVAGERSVCIWIYKKGDQSWGLLHTWTYSQSVMSLQAIPDSSGLLCVTLGHLEITEARVLCCLSKDGPFTQTVVCKDALQAMVGVSNCRLVYCSASADQQKVTVIMMTEEGRVVNTLLLAPAKQNIRTLAVVEGEKDALIGWTECQTLLIWNMKSGHLLQTIYLDKTPTMTNCMRGYSYRGVLCILLQNIENVCDEKTKTTLFTLIATNPLTGKHITLTSISNPSQHIQRLIDGDVFGSGLVGVFQSGHVAVWDLRSRTAKVVCVLDEFCRIARWAGPDTLLTGYVNGNVSVFQCKTV